MTYPLGRWAMFWVGLLIAVVIFVVLLTSGGPRAMV